MINHPLLIFGLMAAIHKCSAISVHYTHAGWPWWFCDEEMKYVLKRIS